MNGPVTDMNLTVLYTNCTLTETGYYGTSVHFSIVRA
jgi:hypothetical protein